MRFASGFATGIIALVCAEVIAWGVVVAAPYREVYREFQGELPAVTRVALSPGWIFAVVAALGLAAAGLGLPEGRGPLFFAIAGAAAIFGAHRMRTVVLRRRRGRVPVARVHTDERS